MKLASYISKKARLKSLGLKRIINFDNPFLFNY